MTSDEGVPEVGDHVVRLPFDPVAARLARDLVDHLLSTHRVAADMRQDAALVVHELVINAILHGQPDPEERIEFSHQLDGDQLVVTVRDWGTAGQVVVRPPSQDAPNGRGLAIVEALASSWSVDRSTGTRVSARIVL